MAAEPPFTDAGADIIIRSSDLVDLRVHKLILSLGSPVFDTMFNLPQPSDAPTAQSALPIIAVSEGSRTMAKFLKLFYPAAEIDVDNLTDVGDMLELSTKYDVEGGGRKRACKLLLSPVFLKNEPSRVFAIAHKYQLEQEVKLAASYTLRHPRFGTQYCTELEHLPAAAYYQLAEYNSRCRDAVACVTAPPDLLWIPSEDFVWFTCTCGRCQPGEVTVRILNGAKSTQPRKWWLDYMRDVAAALENTPCFDAIAISDKVDIALQKALDCSYCAKPAYAHMKRFNEILSAEIEQAISKVR